MPPPRKYKNLPPGTTLSAGGRVRITAGPDRDKYLYRVEAEKKLGRKLGYSEVVDHLDPNTKGDPKAKTKVISRSENSRKDGGLRKGPDGKMRPSKGKKK